MNYLIPESLLSDVRKGFEEYHRVCENKDDRRAIEETLIFLNYLKPHYENVKCTCSNLVE